MVTCPLCFGTHFPTVRNLLKHIRITHADSDNFLIQCGLQGCKRTFKNFHSFKNHVHTFHDINAVDESQHHDEDPPDSDADSTIDDDPGETISSDFGEATSETYEQSIQKAAAVWILKTREGHRLPLSVMDSIISDLQSLHSLVLGNIRDRIETTLQEASVPVDVGESILQHVSDDSAYANIFKGLETQSQQLRYFRNHFHLVVSC